MRAQLLVGPGHHAALDEVHDPVGEQLGVDADVAVVAQKGEHRGGHAADAHLQRGAVGDALDDQRRDRLVALVGYGGGTSTSARSASQNPAT